MTTYTIRVVNQSGATKSYFAFMQSPTVISNGDDPKIYANVWATFESLTDGAWGEVNYNPDGTPLEPFYIADGDFEPGEVIEPGELGAPAEVDFRGRPQVGATVTQEAWGGFSVAYG